MLKLIINITSIADENFYIGTFYQLLKFIVANTSSAYAICGSIIVMCMFATTLRNLIYKVLNLAVLSVFVVALWAYLTDVTFIYVVYILTFVSAVVMLFLSVVLMLPSSAIAVTKRNFLFVLSTATASTSETSIVSTIVNITVGIVCSCLVLAAVYLVFAFFKSWKTRCTFSHYGHPRLRLRLIPRPMTKKSDLHPSDAVCQSERHLFSGYTFYAYDVRDYNNAAAHNCLNSSRDDAAFGSLKEYWSWHKRYRVEYGQKPRDNNNLGVYTFNYSPTDRNRENDWFFNKPPRVQPCYIRAVPLLIGDNYQYDIFHWRRALLLVGYEFINFYVHRLEPELFLDSDTYVAATSKLREFANAYEGCLEYRCFVKGVRSPMKFYAGGDKGRPVYLSIYTPWWSPLRVFGHRLKNSNAIDDAAYRLAVRLDNCLNPKSYKTNTDLRPSMSGFVPPIVSDAISKFIVGVFNSATEAIFILYNALNLHPALVFRLTSDKNTKINSIYGFTGVYYKIINFIFNNLELPLSSKTGGKSELPIFNGFYDLLVPAYDSGTPTLAYNIKGGQYTTDGVKGNRLTFVKNLILFTIINLVIIFTNAVVHVAIFLTAPANIELVAQIVTTTSIFLIAVPVGLVGSWAGFTYGFYLIDAGVSSFAENLAAVQQGLYVGQPLLLLVSITGLLVALIGAPFFVSRSIK